MTPEELPARFASRVEAVTETGCWLWLGHVTRAGGYGLTKWRGKTKSIHRLVYELLVGPIPLGLTLDHRCRVPSCVNPRHLVACTIGENLLVPGSKTFQAANAGKTHCKRGHPFDVVHTYHTTRGNRCCRVCHSDHRRRYRANARTAALLSKTGDQ